VASKRISSSDRRAAILLVARKVFAEHGYDGARTQQIAAAAGVSDTLVFRHFKSKQGLYREVLDDLVAEQDASFKKTSVPKASTQSLLEAIWEYLNDCVHSSPRRAEATRILIANMAGDGVYARLMFKRANRLLDRPVRNALAAADASGDLDAGRVDSINGSHFIAHVGAIISISRASRPAVVPYRGDDTALLRDAFRFCMRGFGVRDEIVQRFERSKGIVDDDVPPATLIPRRARRNSARVGSRPRRRGDTGTAV